MTGRRAAAALAVVLVVGVVALLRSIGSGAGEEELDVVVPVHTTELRRDTLHRFVTAYGRVEPRPAGAGAPAAGAMITPFVDGVLAEVVAVEGRPVPKGAVLFRLDSRLAEVAVQAARQQADFAQSALDRQEQLLSSDGTSQRAYLEARQLRDAAVSALSAAETNLSYLNIESPLAGTVLNLDATVGQRVDASTVLAQVVDFGRLVVSAGVPAREISGIALGQRVLIGSGERTVEGVVTVVGRDVDLANGTYRVQASIPPGQAFVPGEFTDIRVQVEEHADVLVAPEVSVILGPGGDGWISVIEGDRAVRRSVVVGLREAGEVELSGEGLAPGTTIVTDEAYSLPDEAHVRIVTD